MSLITPTKVTEKSKTLIANIFFNSFEFATITDNTTYSISDHLIQYIILDYFLKPSSPYKCNTYIQNFKNFDRNKLKEDFHKINWRKVTHENDNNINDAFNSFYKSLTESLVHHASLTLRLWISLKSLN